MNGDEMVQVFRDDALDADAVSWVPAKVLRFLNRAAKYVARELARHQVFNNIADSENFTTAVNTRAYALSASDIESIYRVVRLDTNGKEIEDIDSISVKQLYDEYGGIVTFWRGGKSWRYYLTRNKSTGAYTINFPRDPSSGVTFTVHYVATPATIAAGGSETEYFDIPSKYHDLVIARAVMMAIGPDSSHIGYATAAYAELKNELQNEAGLMSSPGEIMDEF